MERLISHIQCIEISVGDHVLIKLDSLRERKVVQKASILKKEL